MGQRQARDRGDLDAALNAVVETPDGGEGYGRLARQLRRSGQPRAAVLAYVQARRCGTDSLGARMKVAWGWTRLRAWRFVDRGLRAVLRRRPGLTNRVSTRAVRATSRHAGTERLAEELLEERGQAEGVPDVAGPSGAGRETELTTEQRVLADFLYFGYLPSGDSAREQGEWYARLVRDDDVPVFDHRDLRSVRTLLREIVRDALDRVPSEGYTLGVSSGYDSRTLLGALTDELPRDRIYCFTSGHPGNADYDLAPFFTEGKVRQHELMNLGESLRPSVDALQRRTSNSPSTMPRALGLPRKAAQSNARELLRLPRLHGFLGEISGARLKGQVSADFDEAKGRFTERQARFVKPRHHHRFFPNSYRPDRDLPQEAFLPPDVLSYDDQLDLCYRQHQLIRTLSSQQYTDAELAALGPEEAERFREKRDGIIVPFADLRWQRSFLLSPIEERIEQRLLLNTVREAYPEIFPDLVDPSDQRFHVTKKPTVNSAWDHLWVEDERFRQIVWAVLANLRRRALWFDPLEAIEVADAGEPSFGLLLQGMCSLEMNIRVGKLPDPGWR